MEDKDATDKSDRPTGKSQESLQESITARFGNVRSALGVGTIIQGKLSFDTPVRIDGKLTGEIFSTTALIVGPHGVIDAKVEVAGLVVMGAVKGSIKATQRIELLSGGQITGDVATPVLVMEDGAVLNGDCSMLPPSAKESHAKEAHAKETPQPREASAPQHQAEPRAAEPKPKSAAPQQAQPARAAVPQPPPLEAPAPRREGNLTDPKPQRTEAGPMHRQAEAHQAPLLTDVAPPAGSDPIRHKDAPAQQAQPAAKKAEGAEGEGEEDEEGIHLH